MWKKGFWRKCVSKVRIFHMILEKNWKHVSNVSTKVVSTFKVITLFRDSTFPSWFWIMALYKKKLELNPVPTQNVMTRQTADYHKDSYWFCNSVIIWINTHRLACVQNQNNTLPLNKNDNFRHFLKNWWFASYNYKYYPIFQLAWNLYLING